MVKKLVDNWMKNKENAEKVVRESHPDSYKDLVRLVVETVKNPEYDYLDPDKIHQIDDGDYQGTLVFIIPECSYQPYNYYYCKIAYGSCSGCDTLQRIRDYSDGPPTEEQVKDYMTLMLHIVQGIRSMQEEGE